MKILLVSDYGTDKGGAELQMIGLRRHLREWGHEVRFFSSSVGTSYADDLCFGTESSFRTILQSANVWARSKLSRVLKDFRPDVVHVTLFLTQLSPLILPLLSHFPSVFYAVWYRPVCPTGTKLLPDGTICHVLPGWVCYQNECLPLRDWVPLNIQMRLWNRWRRSFRKITANSHAVGARLKEAGFQEAEVIWPGVPIQPQRPSLKDPPTIGFAGRLVREKGVELLLRAFAQVLKQIQDARLVIAGEGPELKNIAATAGQLGVSDQVQLLGQLSRTELEKHFAGVWVHVVPSVWEEPFGMTAVEAMMRGTAVVASDLGGLREIVRPDQTGILVNAGDPAALAGALVHVLQNRKVAEHMGEEGRKIALADFTEEIFARKFLRVYEQMLQ